MATKSDLSNGCIDDAIKTLPPSDVYLEMNVSLLNKYSGICSPLEYRLIVLLAEKMSFTGLQKNDDKILRSILGCSRASFYRTIKSLKEKKIIGRDYFERLYLTELQGTPYSWKYLIEQLTANTFKRTCWYWAGPRTGDNYGIVPINDVKPLYAHRLSWMIYNGFIPKKQDVHHLCNNPLCVRPDHLKLIRRDRHRKNMPVI